MQLHASRYQLWKTLQLHAAVENATAACESLPAVDKYKRPFTDSGALYGTLTREGSSLLACARRGFAWGVGRMLHLVLHVVYVASACVTCPVSVVKTSSCNVAKRTVSRIL